MTWIDVQPQYHDVVVSTYGRGLFVLRDITRLEQQDRSRTERAGVPLRAAPRLPAGARRQRRVPVLAEGRVAERVPFEILDANGAVIRTLERPGRAGLNRATWDLRYDGPAQVELRTMPPDNPHIWEEARFKGRDTRPIVHWGIQGPQRQGPIAAPGRYTVRMSVGGQTMTQPFEVIGDPKLPAIRLRPRRLDRDADPHPRRHQPVGHDDQPPRGHAEADRGPPEGQRGQEAASNRRCGISTRR